MKNRNPIWAEAFSDQGAADDEAAADINKPCAQINLFDDPVPKATARRDRKWTSSAVGQPAVSNLPRPAAGESSSQELPVVEKDQENRTVLNTPAMWISVPTFDLRGDDFEITSFASLIEPHSKDLAIYTALLKLADVGRKGTRVDAETWRIRIGYSEIRKEYQCSTRALGRAWPRLERLGVVVRLEGHVDRRENLYVVRTPEWLERMYTEAGCTHYRLFAKAVQPFRRRWHEEN